MRPPTERLHRGFKMVRYYYGNGHWVVYTPLGKQIGAVRGIAGQLAAEQFIDEYLDGPKHETRTN